jgi:hypothetical protein
LFKESIYQQRQITTFSANQNIWLPNHKARNYTINHSTLNVFFHSSNSRVW